MRLDQFDLNLLVLLQTLLEEQSVSRTAARLNVTQPAVSNALAKLRRHFGDPLLVRFGGTLRPTPLALQLRSQLTPALVQIRALVGARGDFEPLTDPARLVVACSDWFATTHLARLTRRLPHIAPFVQIEHERIGPEAFTALAEGRIDLLVLRAERLMEDHPSQFLGSEQAVMIGCAKLAPFPAAGAPLERVLEWPQVLAVGSDRAPIMPQLHRSLNRERIVVKTGSVSLLPVMVIGTPYLALLPAAAAHDYQDIYPIRSAPVSGAAELRIYAQWHRHRDQDPVLVWLMAQLEKIQQELKGRALLS